MPKTTKTTVNQNANGQYQVTVPKALGDALDLDEAEVEWAVESSSKLSLEKTND